MKKTFPPAISLNQTLLTPQPLVISNIFDSARLLTMFSQLFISSEGPKTQLPKCFQY